MAPDWQEPQLSTPSLLTDWLLDAGSLTAKLKAISADFRVDVLFQQEQNCQPHERAFLNLTPTAATLVREVLLYCQQTPWVYARSILPLAALTESDQALARMGTNPLGERLFSQANIQPGRIQVATFAPQSKAGQLNTYFHGKQELLWGRRRLFHLQQGAISVAEVFLSPTPCYASAASL